MHIGLVEQLLCPRCGPPYGLILLAQEVRERRVRQGEFGCRKCRGSYPVEAGFGDLRPPPRSPGPSVGAAAGRMDSDPDAAIRLAAALGVARGPGVLLLDGFRASDARALAGIVGDVEVVVVGWGGQGVAGSGVSAFVAGGTIPLRDGAALGVAVGGDRDETAWSESLRVLADGGRIVISGPTDASREWARSRGLVQLLDDGGLLVATAPRTGPKPCPAMWRGPGVPSSPSG
ncbi:MAG: hypothetical protein OXG58_02520 [Gemmatimonadetes bacterium]|nr:hypothetical protein [Gemmatimonadota bacterium]MCY3942823.1 hypothetical protein [Gemmatimonadota bacterium]